MIVRLQDFIVKEILPGDLGTVRQLYGDAFAAQCMEAPDKVEQHWTYNAETGEWSEPAPYEPEHDPEPTTVQKRENAYNTQAVIPWYGEMLTVTEASQKWQYYAAEGNTAKTDELTALIAEAKASIREQYPDEEVEQA